MKKTPLEMCALVTAVICLAVMIVLSLFYFCSNASQDVVLPLFILFSFVYIIIGALKDLVVGESTNGFRPELILIGTSLIYTSLMVFFFGGRLRPVGSINEYLTLTSYILMLLSFGVLATALFYRYYVDRRRGTETQKNHFINPKEFEVETYYTQMHIELWTSSIVVGICILFILAQRLTTPELSTGLVILFFIGGFLALFIRKRSQERIQIILKPDSFTQTGRQGIIISWKGMDHIILWQGIFRKKLFIYYRENDQIKEYSFPYGSLRRKDEFLKFLKVLSRAYGVVIEERPFSFF
jgi:hypothetical protein